MLDWQLLDDYVKRNSQTAFQTLVSRHLNSVRASAMRQVRDVPLAEEVTQAVFILLARKAGKLRGSRNLALGGWLHRTTCFVAATAMRSELRRRQREQEAFQMQQLSLADDPWRHIAPLLDEGIEQLDATSREAIIRRYLQGEPMRNVGEALDISEDAARKRVDRSLVKLRAFFVRRGFTISVAMLANTLAGQKVEAGSAGLAAELGAKALQSAGSAASPLPVLVAETLQAWHWAAVKLAAGVGAAVAIVALLAANVGMNWLRHDTNLDPVKNISSQAVAPVATVPDHRDAAARTSAIPAREYALQVVDALTGRGIPEATVLVKCSRYVKQTEPDILTPLRTDSEGRCNIRLPYANPAMMTAGVVADGYEERSVVENGEKSFASCHVLRLVPGASIGGVVVDEAGRPIAGASVRHYFSYASDGPDTESQRESRGIGSFDGDTAVTDSLGRWKFRSAPTRSSFRINGVMVTHPDFPMAAACFACADNELELNEDKLYAGTEVYTLRKGLTMTGIVTDEFGFFIANAKVEHTGGGSVLTGSDGSFFLRVLPKDVNYVTITAEGFAPWQNDIPNVPDSAPLDVKLNRGAVLRVRVVNETGVPMPGAQLEGWLKGVRWRGEADREGRSVWEHAPFEPISLNATPKGQTPTGENTVNMMITADGEEHVITLRSQHIAAGRIDGSQRE